MITYRHIKHIFRVSEQKGIWILSYSNLAGALAGLVLGNALHGWFPLLPGFLCYPVGILAGIAITFRVWGWPLYTQLYHWGRYRLHHALRPQAYDIDTAPYYTAREPDTVTLLLPRPAPILTPARQPIMLVPGAMPAGERQRTEAR